MSPARTSSTGISSIAPSAYMCDARHPLEEAGQLAPGTAGRILLERVAACEHERDDGAGKVLPERERRCDCDERDRVDPDVAAQERPNDRADERDEDRRRRRSPDRRACAPLAGGVQQRAGRKRPKRGQRKQPARHRQRLTVSATFAVSASVS